ncbi:hypothetical protein HPP92_021745 [Vanilla planifolia]|uniref:Uncharacterized protein n=1 Tax=Vanilla planifolia TaxID=51239 RepID=A0A835UEH0_VANPL|nr:hypothetical protein HPP92_021745 [Vanilla planifolia]
MSSAFAPSVPLFEVPASSAVEAPVTTAAAISSAVIIISHFPSFTKSSTLAVSASASTALPLLSSFTTLTFGMSIMHYTCYTLPVVTAANYNVHVSATRGYLGLITYSYHAIEITLSLMEAH